MLSEELKRDLIERIYWGLKKDFWDKYITLNLEKTIKIISTEDGFKIEIPARMYNFKEWNKNKVIVPYGTGSYAQRVNETGGFSGTHKNYVERAIDEAIRTWFLAHKDVLKGDIIKS